MSPADGGDRLAHPLAQLRLSWLGEGLTAALAWDPEPAPWADPPGRGVRGQWEESMVDMDEYGEQCRS